MAEQDLPPEPNTFKYYVWQIVSGLSFLRAFWGRRISGTVGLVADAIAEAGSQGFYARLPGHPQQALDSLTQVGQDRALYQFRGESQSAFSARVKNAWVDYAQAGTWQQIIRVLNQWGNAGWPATWSNLTSSNLVESGSPSVFTFTVTIPFGLIVPAWAPANYGAGNVYNQSGFYYGIGPSTDLAMLVYLVHKWKPSRSKGFVKIYYTSLLSVTFTV